jgi:far upstream element-binding protein
MIRQKVSDAHVNDSSRFPTQATNPTGQGSINFRIPSNKVGLVIGKGGETLRDFQERSKAKIMIASDSHGDRNHERVITLVGDEACTKLAKTMIEELIFGSTNVSVHQVVVL